MPEPISMCPYIGLQPYTEDEAEYFFGREGDARIISSNLFASPLTVLYGASGVGKTSVLLAAVVPHLKVAPRTAVVVFRKWQDPAFLNALKSRCVKAVEQAQGKRLEIDPGLPFDELLFTAAKAFRGTILIIFDQFEEYFLYQGESSSDEGVFDAEFARAINREEVNANFLIALREDGLSKLDRFRARIPNLMANRLRLEHLEMRAAEDAIRKPIEVFNRKFRTNAPPITIKNELIEEVLRQVRTGQVSLSESAGRGQLQARNHENLIETPFLQLVMIRLWKEEIPAGSIVLSLETLKRTGPAQQIVKSHLDEVMAGLSQDDQKTSARMFQFLVTPKGAKIAHSTEDLVSFAESTPEQVKPVLTKLAEARVLRRISQPERYEVFHDVLNSAILDWRTRHVQFQERAEAERRAEEQRRRADKQASLARLLTGVSIVLVFVSILAGFFWLSASKQNKINLEQNKSNLALQIALKATSLSEDRLDLALLLSSEANRLSGTPEVRGSLLSALSSTPNLTAFLPPGNRDTIRSVAFSPDGRTLATAGDDRKIVLWNTNTYLPVGPPLVGHGGRILSVAFSPDGKILASGSDDKKISLWDVASGQPLDPPLINPFGAVRSVDFSPDGEELASGTDNGTVLLWRISTREPMGAPMTSHSQSIVYSVAFSPRARILASCGADGAVIFWDLSTHRPIGSPLEGHSGPVYSLAFSPNGKILASGGLDGNVILWNVQSRKQLSFSPLKGHLSAVRAIDFSPDGKTLASAGWDRRIILWDLADAGEGRQSVPFQIIPSHSDRIYSLRFDPRTNQKNLASGGTDGAVALWNFPAKKWLGRPLLKSAIISDSQGVTSVAFGAKGKQLASGGKDGEVILWDAVTRKPIGLPLKAHDGTVTSVAFSPDGKLLASGGSDTTIILWDPATGKQFGSPLNGHDKAVTSVAFSPDSKLLASGSRDKTIVLWNTTTGKPIGSPLKGHDGTVTSVAFSPDGKVLASGSLDQKVVEWDIEHQKPLRSLNEDNLPVYTIAFNHDGTILASGNANSISLWDADSGRRFKLPGAKHKGNVLSLAFSPDGKLLASGSLDKTIILWDAKSFQRLGPPLEEQNAPINALAFSPDGKKLFSGSEKSGNNQTLILWDVDFASWQSRACDIVNRSLTDAEWEQYLPNVKRYVTCPVSILAEAHVYGLEGEIQKASTAFDRAVQLGNDSYDPLVNNRICWYGSLDGFAKIVKPACDRAVKLSQGDAETAPVIRGSRGVERAMVGDYPGAIEDFTQFVDWAKDKDDFAEQMRIRANWISQLEKGQNPINDSTLKALLRE